MKKLLLFALTYFLLFGIATAQSALAKEQSVSLPYLQDDESTAKNRIEIFPNPAVEFIYIKIHKSDLENIEMELFNIIGNSLSFDLEEIEQELHPRATYAENLGGHERLRGACQQQAVSHPFYINQWRFFGFMRMNSSSDIFQKSSIG